MQDTVIIIPVYEPTQALVPLVTALQGVFPRIILVDDGSTANREILERTASLPSVTLLRHEVNRGKGAALKTAFRYVLDTLPGTGAVITVDADGQHLVKDILAVAKAADEHRNRMILGVRTFPAGTPFRSRLGNYWTIGEFALLTRRPVHDTQSGLRAIPSTFLEGLLSVPGERYEYEIGVLVALARRGLVTEVPISAVYLDGNSSSHFRPLRDTLRTQAALFRAALSKMLRCTFAQTLRCSDAEVSQDRDSGID